MHAAGGTSSGAVITICEIAVYGYNVQNTASSIDAGDQKRTGPVTLYAGQLSTVQRPAIPTCISKYGCSQLKDMYGGWKLETSFNAAAAVCGESDNGLGGCGKDQCFGGIVSGGQVRQHRKETQPLFVLKQCLCHRRVGSRRRPDRGHPPDNCDRGLAARQQDLQRGRRASVHGG